MKEATQKRVSGASGKISTAGQYANGGMACKSGCSVEMKKGGKSKSPAKKSAPKKTAKSKDKAWYANAGYANASTQRTSCSSGLTKPDVSHA